MHVETATRRTARRSYPVGGRAGAVLAGGVPVLAFPEPNLWPLAWVGLVPLLHLVRTAGSAREAAVRGWLGGAGLLLAAHYWLVPNLGPFLLLVVAAVGALWAPWGGVTWRLLAPPCRPPRAVAAVFVVPAGWVLIETARSWEYLGGPFGLLGASQWRQPALLGLAPIGGVWLVSFAIVAANVGVLLLVTAHGAVRTGGAVAAVAALAAGPIAYAGAADPAADRVLSLAMVQPGVVHRPAPRLAAGQALTARLAEHDPDLVVWGESSVGFDLDRRPNVRAALIALARAVGADLLVDVDARRPTGGIAKTSVLLDGNGIRGKYVKTRLVPFGEYVPFRPLLQWLTRHTEAAGEDRHRGHGVVVLDTSAGVPTAPLTCFEAAFPDLARTAARRGAALVAYQSSMSTFQGSWAPEQQASLGAIRAAEIGRPVVSAALTGVSAAYDGRGRLLAAAGTSERTAVVVDVPLTARSTPYVRYGNWVPWTCAAVVVGAGLTAARRRSDPRPR